MLARDLSKPDYARLFRLAKRVALRADGVSVWDAEDIAHDVLLGLWSKLKESSEIACMEAWVAAAAKYAAYRWTTRERGRRIREDLSVQHDMRDGLSGVDLSLAISSLRVPYGNLCRMRFFEEMTIEEIAKELRISQGTVKRRLAGLVSC